MLRLVYKFYATFLLYLGLVFNTCSFLQQMVKSCCNDVCFLLQVWFNDKIFDPAFAYYTGYKIPVCKALEQYMEYIQTLPSVDTPQVFGLHPNADIT